MRGAGTCAMLGVAARGGVAEHALHLFDFLLLLRNHFRGEFFHARLLRVVRRELCHFENRWSPARACLRVACEDEASFAGTSGTQL